MIEKLKQEAMRQGMKLLSNPKVMKVMADPRFMNAIGQGFALRGRIQMTVEEKLRSFASMLNLVTRDEIEEIKRDLTHVENTVNDLENKIS
jgi:hypothetical protein